MIDYNAVEILLIEDNPDDAELTIRAFKKQNIANQIFWIEDGEEALNFIFCKDKYSQRNFFRPPKIILLDLKIPKINGLEVLRKIKEDERTKRIPVVVVTSSREDPDISEAYNLGVNSYVVKPVDFDAFAHAMSSLGLYWLLINQGPQ